MNNHMSAPSTPDEKQKARKDEYHLALQAYYPKRVAYDHFLKQFAKFQKKYKSKSLPKGSVDYQLYDAYEDECEGEDIKPDRESLYFSASEEEKLLIQKLEEFIKSLEPGVPTMDFPTEKVEKHAPSTPSSGKWGFPQREFGDPLPDSMNSSIPLPARMGSDSPASKLLKTGRVPWYV